MELFGAAIGGAIGGFGEKPKVPNWKNIRLGEQQQQAIQNNITALPGAENLSSQTTQFNLDQIQKMLEFGMPNYQEITSQATDNISSWLRGEIPADVASAVQTSSAGRSLAGGYGGTGMGRNLEARDLGLTSLDLMSRGQSSAESWMKTTDSIFGRGVMDVTRMFVSPMDQFGATMGNQMNKWNQQWNKAQVDAAPDPWMAALAQAGISDSGAIRDTMLEMGSSM